jgi:tRNA(Ile)-lysidine synthase
MLQPGERVVAAVSGGADSMALLHALFELRKEYDLSLLVAHVDHGLRPEGPAEMGFVRLAADHLGLPFVSRRVDAGEGKRERGLTLQESAREARYGFLTQVAGKRRASKVALGHTADDQAESVMMRILRGAGTRGLAGIPPVRGNFFIRPLIHARRAEVESFLRQIKVEYLSDPSNLSRKYLRNRIRLELLPVLEEYNPRIRESLAEMADLFRNEEEFWQNLVDEKFPEVLRSRGRKTLTLNIPALVSLPAPLRLRCFRTAVETLAGNLRRIGLAHIRAIDDLWQGAKPNKEIKIPQSIRVRKAYDAITFSICANETNSYEYSVSGPGQVDIPEIGRTMRFEVRRLNAREPLNTPPNVALADFRETAFPLMIRSIRPGDRFQPLGMRGEKKVKDLFIDSKIPAPRRREIPLVCKGERLLWVAGLRLDDRARIKPETRMALRMELV